jgi:hypothetical protein
VEGLKIVGVCVVGAIVYGILHDLVTANICVEYFSVFHPDVFHTDSPWLLALGWGVRATWWVGLFLGSLIAGAARSGQLPRIGWGQLLKPLLFVYLSSYAAAIGAGIVGFTVIREIPMWVFKQAPQVAAAHLSPEKQRAFTADLFAHNASYITSTAAVLVLCIWVIRTRMKLYRPFVAGQRPI